MDKPLTAPPPTEPHFCVLPRRNSRRVMRRRDPPSLRRRSGAITPPTFRDLDSHSEKWFHALSIADLLTHRVVAARDPRDAARGTFAKQLKKAQLSPEGGVGRAWSGRDLLRTSLPPARAHGTSLGFCGGTCLSRRPRACRPDAADGRTPLSPDARAAPAGRGGRRAIQRPDQEGGGGCDEAIYEAHTGFSFTLFKRKNPLLPFLHSSDVHKPKDPTYIQSWACTLIKMLST